MKATSAVLWYKHLWIERRDYIFVWQQSNQSTKKIQLMDDSDIESNGDSSGMNQLQRKKTMATAKTK